MWLWMRLYYYLYKDIHCYYIYISEVYRYVSYTYLVTDLLSVSDISF